MESILWSKVYGSYGIVYVSRELHHFENLLKEEADHFDVQKPLTIQVADKEKIGKVETGHHRMKVSAIYNIRDFKFDD